MILDRLSWLAMGAVFSLVLCGWPWHPRFRPYNRRAVQRRQGNGGPSTEKPAIVAKPQPQGGRILKPWE